MFERSLIFLHIFAYICMFIYILEFISSWFIVAPFLLKYLLKDRRLIIRSESLFVINFET